MVNIISFVTIEYQFLFINSSFFLCILFFLLIIFLIVKNRRSVNKERKDAIKRSRAVIKGQMAEQMAPFFPDFPCNPNDVKFIGKPIDFVGFTEDEIIFIEMKTGNSQLNENEKRIKRLIESKKVRYIEYKVKI